MKRMIALVLLLSLALSMAACDANNDKPATSASTTDAAAENTTEGAAPNAIPVKYATTFPAVGTQATGVQYLTDRMAEHSSGHLAVEFYPANSLGDKTASMEGLVAGTIEMTTADATSLSSYSSIWSVLALPYLWDSGDQAVAVLTDPEVKAFIDEDLAEVGFIIIGWANAGSRSMLNKVRPIEGPADLADLKIRCMEDPVLAGAISAMGASATPLPSSEVYTALQQGMIDGCENNMPTILDNGFMEIAKYYSLTEHFIIPDPTFISKTWFDSLPAEDQEAVLKAGKDFTKEYCDVIWPDAEASATQRMEDAGVQINSVDKSTFVEATKPVIETFLSTADTRQVEFYELLMRVREKY